MRGKAAMMHPLHSIFIRGIERRGIFKDDKDREDLRVKKDPGLTAATGTILPLLPTETSQQ